jgi:hypothetical protein
MGILKHTIMKKAKISRFLKFRTHLKQLKSSFPFNRGPLSLLLCFIFLSCSKEDVPKPLDLSNLSVVTTDKGQVIPGGIYVQKNIGREGGTVQSPGGEIKIQIPSGALNNTQSISIQEISNTAPLGAGKSFRLSPEGTTFLKPVKITMKYGDTPSMFAWIVTQKEDGTWLGDTRTLVDEVEGTVSVETTHFSDWANGRIIDLKASPAHSTLGVNKSKDIVITGFAKPDPGEVPDLVPLKPIHPKEDEDLVGIPSMEELLRLDRYHALRLISWTLDGVPAPTSGNKGKLKANNFSAQYTAPAKVPNPQKVQVSASIEGTRADGSRTKVILASNIDIIDGYYLRIELDGQEYMLSGDQAILAFTPRDNEKMILQAIQNEDFILGIRIMDETPDFSGKPKVYTIGDEATSLPNTVELLIDGMKNSFYNLSYSGVPYLQKCIPDANSIKFEPVRFSMVRNGGKFLPGVGKLYDIEGTFSTKVYYYNMNEVPCGPAKAYTLKGEFLLQGTEITVED